MTKLGTCLLVCICALVPTAVTADDGGFWDWLQKQSGPKLMGIGTDIHLLCLDSSHKAIPCERLWGLRRKDGRPVDVAFNEIRHEIDFRIAFYWKYGSRFSDVIDGKSIYAWKLMTMYHYHVNDSFAIGGGYGYIPFFGDGFDLFSRGIVTPVSVVVYPFQSGNARGLFLRPEFSYISQGLSGAAFGNSTTTYSTTHEWNGSLAIGFDFRRRPKQP